MNSDFPHPDSFHATYFVFLTIHFLYLMAPFTLIINKLLETPLLAHWGGGGGGGGSKAE